MNVEEEVRKILSEFIIPAFYTIHTEHLNFLSDIEDLNLNLPPKEIINSFIAELYVCLLNREDYNYHDTVANYTTHFIRLNEKLKDDGKFPNSIKHIVNLQSTYMLGLLNEGLSELDMYTGKENVKMLEKLFLSLMIK